MKVIEKIAREMRQNDALARLAAQQMRACQIRNAQLRSTLSDELDRVERRRERRVK